MPTPIDDLRVGFWIAITVTEGSCGDMFDPFSMRSSQRRGLQVDGRPLQIQAISLPFICVTDGSSRMAVDIRAVEVQKLEKSYVKLLRNNGFKQRDIGRGNGMYGLDYWVVPDVEEKPPVQAELHDPRGTCPMCGNHLIERLINAESRWILACKQCGFEGTIPHDSEGA